MASKEIDNAIKHISESMHHGDVKGAANAFADEMSRLERSGGSNKAQNEADYLKGLLKERMSRS